MKLIITIDTEEDNWGDYTSPDYTLHNIERIPELQQLFDQFDAIPTYLVTYPVISHEKSVMILNAVLERGRCEIGTHCHPWNTPPLLEEICTRNTMLCNLPEAIQYKKIWTLHQMIRRYFGIEPVCFRTGRWGFSRDIADNLYKLGYKVDTSITPYTDWTNSNGPDFSDYSPQPFRIDGINPLCSPLNGHLVEVPATIGFLQSNYSLSNSILRVVKRMPFRRFRLTGILHRLDLVNRVWLSPELSDAPTMIRLTRTMLKNNYPLINMVFHSPSLKAGLTPFVRTKSDETRFLNTIEEYLRFTREAGIESIKLCDSLKYI